MLDVSNNPHDFSRDILRQFKNWDSEHLMIVPNMKYMNYNYLLRKKDNFFSFLHTYIGQRELSIIDKKFFFTSISSASVIFGSRYVYTHYLLQGTVYKGQLWQLVEFWKNIRDGLVFFPKVKGQDTIHQGTKD